MKPEDSRPPSSSSNPSPRTAHTSEHRPARRGRVHWLWIVLGVLVVLGIIGAFSARPVWRAIKAHRAEGFVGEAEALVKEEKGELAVARLRSALQLVPKHPSALRLAARIGSAEMALHYLELLLGTSDGTTADREEYATVAFRAGNRDLAATQIRDLLTLPTPSARTYLLASQLHGAGGNYSNAVHYAREAVRVEPANPTNVVTLGRTLQASKVPADLAEARRILWPIARAEGPLQAVALASAIANPDSPRSDREEVSAILAAKPKRSIAEEILYQDVAVSLDPSRRTAIADDFIESHGRASHESTTAVAAWLNRHQLFSRTLDLVLPDIASKDLQLVHLRYDALVGMEDLRGAYDFVSNVPDALGPYSIEFLRCSTAIRMKNSTAIDSHFQNLLTIAGRQPRLLREVLEFAIRNGRKDIANESAKRLASSPRDAAAAYATLLKIADGQGETMDARDYAKKLLDLKRADSDETLRLQIAYYDLLLDENIEAAFKTAEAMHKAQPDDFTRRAVLGLGYLRKNQPKPAVDLIDHQFVTWAKLPPGVRAVTIAVLGANNRQKASAKLIARVPLSRLKPEERELIRPYAGTTPEGNLDENEAEAAPEKL